ncbi:unnamed protein product [Zymoseptoria tritici ST99CH_3D7]|uniref:Nuclear condensin complex subunit 3 C-terminal domain-containing protein n=1 Tax=Zymoseptoria tritici (strain ST99CH_3D7) TaxID=1276538 RepID=A0A1X7S1J3_ZYMT9|nr:unnamed protein product [Zymoseptoria tritici ST99CH_3D7]
MPGRVASGTAARTSRRTTRTASPTPSIPDEGESSSLRRAVCATFADAQRSTAAHRKAIISLRKVQEACCYEPVSNKKSKQTEDFDEEDFNREVVRCVLRILPVKKAEGVGDRAVRFLGTFLNVASGKDNEIVGQGDPDDTVLPETPTSRLTTQILTTLLPLLQAKDKAIRYRTTQITSHVINSLDTLDDGLFHQLRLALLKRIHDKEATVRLQAVYGLGRLAAEVEDNEEKDDSDSEDDAAAGVLGKLLNVLQNDPSAEVRRNLLLNLPLTKEVLPYLLERARDADATTRRALYARLLPALGDFRHLSLTHREKLLRWGLRDRDDKVRDATAKLFRDRWIEDCAALPAAQAEQEDGAAPKPADQAAPPSLDALLELLERIDVVNSGGEGGIALIAMKEFWHGRPDYLEYVSFPESFWDDLSPELAFVARTFNDYCRSEGKTGGYTGPLSLETMVEEKLPEVTRFGFLLEREIKRLIETTINTFSEEEDLDDEELAHREFVVEQMLHTAITFDYSDEVGRRKMFGLMRESLALPDLPEEVTRLVVEVLRLVCGEDAKGEREFCGVVLEAIAEVHDTIMGEGDDADSTSESFHSATSNFDGEDDDTIIVEQKKAKKAAKGESNPEAENEKAVREIMVNMKCLHIALCMLQNVQCDLEENVHLVTMLNNLVVPAVRSQEAPIRERGLMCLGLCCLLGKNLADENLTLFIHCFSKGHPALQTICLQIITDILVTHPTLLKPSPTTPSEDSPHLRPVLKAYTKSLKSPNASVSSTGALALSKTFLSHLLTDSDLLKQLVLAYFDAESAANPHLRQTLAYFLPVYCHSRAENAERMAEIATAVVAKCVTLREALLDDAEVEAEGDGADGMVKVGVVGSMLCDWTDPRKILGANGQVSEGGSAGGRTHYALAESILERLVTTNVTKEERKVLFAMLGRLYFPPGACAAESLKTLLELATEAVDGRVAPDAVSRNVLTKLQNGWLKLIGDVMTAERGGGGAEETMVALSSGEDEEDVTEVGDATTVTVAATEAEDEDDTSQIDVDEQLQREMRDTTIGGATMTNTTGFGLTGIPDAEGTRIEEADGEEYTEVEDSEMMDVDG